jgi:tetratricopeptide (TPR) repeat protein
MGGDSQDGKVYRNLGELEYNYDRRKEKHSSYTIADVTVGYSYFFMITKDGSFFGPFSDNITKSGSNSDRVYKYAITAMLIRIRNDIAPYKNTISYSIQKKAWTENKAVDKELDKAFSHFSKGACYSNNYCDAKFSQKDYKLALEAYLGIYERHKSIAAALNASYLYHALGDTKSALSFMKKIEDKITEDVIRQYQTTKIYSLAADRLSSLYHALGDTKSALNIMKKVHEETSLGAPKVVEYYHALGDTESALSVLHSVEF